MTKPEPSKSDLTGTLARPKRVVNGQMDKWCQTNLRISPEFICPAASLCGLRRMAANVRPTCWCAKCLAGRRRGWMAHGLKQAREGPGQGSGEQAKARGPRQARLTRPALWMLPHVPGHPACIFKSSSTPRQAPGHLVRGPAGLSMGTEAVRRAINQVGCLVNCNVDTLLLACVSNFIDENQCVRAPARIALRFLSGP